MPLAAEGRADWASLPCSVTAVLITLFSCKCSRTANSVLGASTSLVLGNLLAGFENWDRPLIWSHHGDLQVQLLNLGTGPADDGLLDLLLAGDQKDRGHVGETVCIGDAVAPGVLEQDGKGDGVLLDEKVGALQVVLRDSHEGDGLGLMRLIYPLKIGKGILAHWT